MELYASELQSELIILINKIFYRVILLLYVLNSQFQQNSKFVYLHSNKVVLDASELQSELIILINKIFYRVILLH